MPKLIFDQKRRVSSDHTGMKIFQVKFLYQFFACELTEIHTFDRCPHGWSSHKFELSNFITNWKELANFDLLYTVRSLWPVFQRKLSRRRLPITFVYFLSHASTKVLRPIKFAQRSRSIFLMSIDRKNTLVENFELLISSKYINIFIRSQSKMLYVSREACCRKTIFTSTCK